MRKAERSGIESGFSKENMMTLYPPEGKNRGDSSLFHWFGNACKVLLENLDAQYERSLVDGGKAALD